MTSMPAALSSLLDRIAGDFPLILGENLTGIYLWGSLTYDAFDESCSDLDMIVVTERDLSDKEFSSLAEWFKGSNARNPWMARLDMRFIINGEFLDKTSRCCGFYSGELVRHGSDGNPIIWLNIGKSGITLWGRKAQEIAPSISDGCLNDALRLELAYLREALANNAGDRSEAVFKHNAYSTLTTCRILFTANFRTLTSKELAFAWALSSLPHEWHPVIETAKRNRRARSRETTPQLEADALRFVLFAEGQMNKLLTPNDS